MRSLAFLMISMFLFFSCTNEKNENRNNDDNSKEMVQEKQLKDSFPDAKWNGEYMKIDDGSKPKIKRKSQGSDFYSMGSVKLNIGDDLVDFKLFERKKNALSFTNRSITAFIRSAFNEDLNMKFKKEDIIIHHKGKYKVDPTGEADNSVKMSIKHGKKDQQREYTLESGVVEIIHFSPRVATLELKIKGLFVSKDGKKHDGEGTIKMNFEHAVMTAS